MFYISPTADTTCLSLCSQVLELMLAAVQCNQDCSLTTITVVFRDLHKHWKSFVSKLKCDPPKIGNLYVIISDGLFVSLPPPDVLLYSLKRPELCVLTTHALKALSLVLVHSAEVGVASEGVCAKSIINVKETLDQDYITADSEVSKCLSSYLNIRNSFFFRIRLVGSYVWPSWMHETLPPTTHLHTLPSHLTPPSLRH